MNSFAVYSVVVYLPVLNIRSKFNSQMGKLIVLGSGKNRIFDVKIKSR